MKLFTVFLSVFICFVLLAQPDTEQMFEQACSKSATRDAVPIFEKLSREYPDDLYGQKALLELAKLALLERNYQAAIELLKSIYLDQISEKEFWLAKAYLENKEPDRAIISAQNYISDSDNISQIETAYFIIAEAYIQKDLFQRAVNTLEFLRTSEFINNNIPLLHYKFGYCYEKSGKFEKALNSYKKLKLDFPFDRLTYLADDRIYNLQKNDLIDVGNLSNYRNREEKNTETKISKGEYRTYLQIGAFSLPQNAEKQGVKAMELGFNFTVFIKKRDGKTFYAVAVGPFDGDRLKPAMKKLSEHNIDSFVIKR